MIRPASSESPPMARPTSAQASSGTRIARIPRRTSARASSFCSCRRIDVAAEFIHFCTKPWGCGIFDPRQQQLRVSFRELYMDMLGLRLRQRKTHRLGRRECGRPARLSVNRQGLHSVDAAFPAQSREALHEWPVVLTHEWIPGVQSVVSWCVASMQFRPSIIPDPISGQQISYPGCDDPPVARPPVVDEPAATVTWVFGHCVPQRDRSTGPRRSLAGVRSQALGPSGSPSTRARPRPQ